MTWVDLTSVGRSHSFRLASALHSHALLRTFHTGILMPTPDGYVARYLTPRLSAGNQQRLAARLTPDVPSSCVRSYPMAELLEQTGQRLLPFFDKRMWNFAASSIFDALVAQAIRSEPPAVVHAFEHSALRTFVTAKNAGSISVLEQPIIHIDAFLSLERDAVHRTKVASLRRPLGFSQHVIRKNREYALADYCFVGLPTAADSMIAGGFPKDRVFVTPYGAPASELTSSKNRPLRRGKLRVLFVGHLDFYKGLDVLLDAWDMLPADRFELTVVGISNPSWDSYFRERIEAAEGVQYLGALPHGTMPAIYARHDVLAFPSLVGGVGLSTFEAMAAGVVPLVPSDEGLLRAGVDCVVVPRHEGNAWAAALTQLDADRLLLSSMADAGIVAAAATPTQYTEAVVNAYRTIAAREGLEPLMETLSHS